MSVGAKLGRGSKLTRLEANGWEREVHCRVCGEPGHNRVSCPRRGLLVESGEVHLTRPASAIGHFPGATAADLDSAPPVCPRCGGGWDLEPLVPGSPRVALACRLCGRRCYVAAELAAAVVD